MWDVTTGEERGGALIGHTSQVRGVCLVGGGSSTVLLASAGDDQTIRLWNPSTDTLVHTIPIGLTVHALSQTLDTDTTAGYRHSRAAAIVVGTSDGVLALNLHSSLFAAPPNSGG
jgi:WD40 repeat protein